MHKREISKGIYMVVPIINWLRMTEINKKKLRRDKLTKWREVLNETNAFKIISISLVNIFINFFYANNYYHKESFYNL